MQPTQFDSNYNKSPHTQDDVNRDTTNIAIMKAQKTEIAKARHAIEETLRGDYAATLPHATKLGERTVSAFTWLGFGNESVDREKAKAIAQERDQAMAVATAYEAKIEAHYEILKKVSSALSESYKFLEDSIDTQHYLDHAIQTAFQQLQAQYHCGEEERLNAAQIVDKLVENIGLLRQQVSGQGGLLLQAQKEKNDLQQQLAQQKQQIYTLQQQHKNIQQQLQAQQQNHQHQHTQRASLAERKEKGLQNALNEKDSQLKQVRQALEDKILLATNLQQSLAQEKAMIQQLHNKNSALEKNLAEINTTFSSLKLALEEKDQLASDNFNVASKNYHEWEQANQQNTALNQKLKELQQKVIDLQAEKEENVIKAEQLQQQLQKTTSDKEKISLENTALTQKLAKHNEQLNSYEQQIMGLKKQIEETTEHTQKSVNKFKDKNSEYKLQQEQMQSQFQEIATLHQFIEQTKTELHNTRDTLKQKEAEVSTSAEEIKKLKDELTTLQKQLVAQTDIDKLKSDIEGQFLTIKRTLKEKSKKVIESSRQAREVAILKGKNNEIKELLERSEKETRLLRKKLTETQKKLNQANGEKASNDQESSDIHTKQLNNELKKLQGEKAESDEKIMLLEKKQVSMKSQIEQLEEQNKLLEQELQVMQVDFSNNEQAFPVENEDKIVIAQLENLTEKLSAENEELRDELAALQNEDGQFASLQSIDVTGSVTNRGTQIQQLHHEKAVLNERVEMAEKKINELQRALGKTEDGYEKYKRMHEPAEQKLEDENKKLKKEVKAYQSKVAEDQEKLKRLSAEKDKIKEQALDKEQQMQKEWQELQGELAKEIGLKHKHKFAGDAHDAALTEIDQLKQQLIDSKQQQQAVMNAIAGFTHNMMDKLNESDRNTMQETMEIYFKQFT